MQSAHSLRVLTVLVLLLGACTAVAADPPGPMRPNIIVFLVDDLGWQDVALPLHTDATAFNRRYRTPHLLQLAERGVAFTQAYASAPVCTPTRTSLMTGRSPARTHITYWTLHADTDTSAPYAGLRPPAWDVNALQPDDVTLPQLLGDAGYRTIHAGKAHLGAVGTPGADPTQLGFDVNIAGHGAGAPASYLGTDGFSTGSVWDVPGLEAYHGRELYLTEVLTTEAIAAVRAAVQDETPFFLHFAPYAVHTPIMANGRYLDERYADLPAPEAAYATMIETVDAALGALLGTLDELGLSDDTVIVFTSDNGGLSAHARGGTPHTHNAPLRSGKGSVYEGGVRVPTVIAVPQVTSRGARCATPIVTHDLFPTLLALAEVPVPRTHAAALDGVDLRPLLGGRPAGAALAERALVWHQPHFWGLTGPGIWPFSSVRSGDWKLVYRHRERTFELYDLAVDLGETTDRADDRPRIVDRLAALLGSELRRRDAQMSLDADTGRPVPWPDEVAPGAR